MSNQDQTLHSSTDGPSPNMPASQMPLSFANEGELLHIVRVTGSQANRQHLAELGFVEGAEVTLVSRVNGDVVVCVKGANFALGCGMATHIFVG
ncbi:FeoA family protein [Atopobium deltae]|nr:FeoA family protein [Atopobium deltae]